MIEPGIVEHAVDKAAIRYDRDGDQHYDVMSAFIKSIRGSDVQLGALPGPGRGEDPRFIARRLVILASEDIGLSHRTPDRGRGGTCGAVHRHAGGRLQSGPGRDRAPPSRPSPMQ